MKKLLFLSFFGTLLFSDCRKQEPALLNVTYKVGENTAASPTYTISYTSDKSGNTTIASTSDYFWESPSCLLEQGQFLSMTVSSSDATFDLLMRVYINGVKWGEERFTAPVNSKTISGIAPQ